MAIFKNKKKKRSEEKDRLAATILYDSLMAEIEPELTTIRLPSLQEDYEDETEEEAAGRGDRYRKAFQIFGELWGEFFMECQGKMREYEDLAMSYIARKSGAADAKRMGELENIFDDKA